MIATQSFSQPKVATAAELRQLPAAERDAILIAAAAIAEAEYQSGSELTNSESFGAEDLHGQSANDDPNPR